jgi:hypothetical protein
MMRTLIILILVLLVLGLYFFPGITKDAMDITGNFVVDTFKGIFN